MIRYVSLCAVVFLSAIPSWAALPSADVILGKINQITLAAEPQNSRVAREFLDISDRGKYIDVMIKELFLSVDLPDELMNRFVADFSLDSGQWSDIDYLSNDRSGWEPSFHALRLYTLARAYKSPDSKHHNCSTLRAILLRGIDYWSQAKLVCPNWWYNDIGVPKLLGPVYLLLKDEMSAEQIAAAQRIMSRSKFAMTGQNKVALAGNIVMRALLTDDVALVARARDTIASEIYMATAEGLQPDFSFHQHGPMMQFGNYGLAYIASMAYWGRVFAGTDLAFDTRQRELLANYALRAMRWTVWRGSMDIASCGRQIFTNAPRGKAHALALAMSNMAEFDTTNRHLYLDFVQYNQTDPMAENRLVGSKMFWRSDYLINRAKDWFASVRMSSNRTYGFEMTNSENLQGHYSADGVTQIYVDGNEYEEIFPVWNWRQLPGLTAQNSGEKLPVKYNYYSNLTDFVGGIAAQGVGAMAAMELVRDSLTARKSYFMIGEQMVCLGAGISCERPLLTTTAVEQALLLGAVTYGIGDKELSLPRGEELSFTGGGLSWVHQNKVGYVMLHPMDVTISATPQVGSWSRIALFYRDWPQVEKDVFKIVISHGTHPRDESYAYAVLANRTSKETAQMARRLPVRVVRNDAQCQAVSDEKGDTLLCTFYRAGAVELKNLYVEVRAAALVSFARSDGVCRVAVSDPTQKRSSVELIIGKSKSTARSYLVELPTGEATLVDLGLLQ